MRKTGCYNGCLLNYATDVSTDEHSIGLMNEFLKKKLLSYNNLLAEYDEQKISIKILI